MGVGGGGGGGGSGGGGSGGGISTGYVHKIRSDQMRFGYSFFGFPPIALSTRTFDI